MQQLGIRNARGGEDVDSKNVEVLGERTLQRTAFRNSRDAQIHDRFSGHRTVRVDGFRQVGRDLLEGRLDSGSAGREDQGKGNWEQAHEIFLGAGRFSKNRDHSDRLAGEILQNDGSSDS